MNRSYRLVWNAALRVVQVVSELARAGGASRADGVESRRRALLVAAPLALAVAFGLASPAQAAVELPVFDSATGATPVLSIQGNTLTFSQPDPSNVWVNWSSFNIGAGGTANFQQTLGAITTASHSVTGGTISSIAGTLSMQGRHALADAQGITIGSTGVVGGDDLVLAAMAMSPAANGMPAAYEFDAMGAGASLVNAGTISTAGSAVLLGSSVRNEGSIAATGNTIHIVAASHVSDSGPLNTAAYNFLHTPPTLGGYIALAGNSGQPAIENIGTITDPAGNVILEALGGDIVNSGTIQASGGRVGLYSDTKVLMTGTIDTSQGAPISSVAIGAGYVNPAGTTPAVAYVGDSAVIRTTSALIGGTSDFGGRVDISAHDALHLGGTIDVHGHAGGSLNIASDGYLEADARVYLSRMPYDGSGSLAIRSGDAMVVTDAVVARIDANGTYTPGGPSQVGASMLSMAGGDISLTSDSDIAFNADVTLSGQTANLVATSGGAIELAAGRTLSRSSQGARLSLLATQGLVLDANTRLGEDTSHFNSIELKGGEVDTGAEINADDLKVTATHGDVTQAGGVIKALSSNVSATGDVSLTQDNQFSYLTVTAGGNLALRTLNSLQLSANVAGSTTIDALSDVTAHGSSFGGMITVTSRDLMLDNQSALTMGAVDGRNVSLYTYNGAISLTDRFDVSGNATIGAGHGSLTQSATPLSIAGNAYFGASGDVILDNPANQVGGAVGGSGTNVRIANNGDMQVGSLSATNQLWLSTGSAAGKVTLLNSLHAASIYIDGSLLMGQDPFPILPEQVIGSLTTTGYMSVEGKHGYIFNGDISVGTDLTNAVTSLASVFNGGVLVNGSTHLTQGAMVVGDDAHHGATLTSDVSVAQGAALSGTGTVIGNVTVAQGGSVAPGDGGQYIVGDGFGTLTIDGSLALNGGGLSVKLGTPGADAQTVGLSDRLHVTGDAVIDNAPVDVRAGDGMAPGLYTVFDYGGTYTALNGGFHLGTAPAGDALQLLDRSDLKRLDVILRTDLPIQFWNANGLASGARYGGGSGTWGTLGATWADASGAWQGSLPDPGFAVFAGDRGDVSVDDSKGTARATGLQFATDGYTLGGDHVRLVATGTAAPVIRVGDGTSMSSGYKATINSVLTGRAGLVKADYGTLVLTAANTYTGGTTISGGAIEVAQDTALGDGSGYLSLDGGALRVDGTYFNATRRAVVLGTHGGGFDIVDAANTFTLTQSLGGSGSLSKRGDGTLSLTGSNTYTGGTSIAAGTLRGSTLSLQGDIANNGTLVFDQPTDGRYAGFLSGTGEIVKSGAGMLVFDGQGNFSGHTSIAAGSLQIGDESTPGALLGGAVDLAAGASLSGHGRIGGDLVAHGTVAPGSIGTLTVGGDATLASDSTLYIDTSPAGASRLAVAGHATIDGARLVVDAQGATWIANNHYDVLTAGGGVTGQFAAVDSHFAFLNAIIAYSAAGKVSLDLQRNAVSFLDAASTPNQRAVAMAADSLGVGHAVYDRVVAMDESAAERAFSALAGDLHASAQSVIVDDQRQVRDAVTRHMLGDDDGRQGAHGDDGHGVTTWLSVLGHDADYDGNANAGKIDSSGSGALLGMDVAVDGDARIGVLLGHAKQSLHERSLDGSAKVHSNQFGLYGDVAFDALTLRGGIVHAHHDIDTTRHVTLGDETSRLDADRDAASTQGFAELGYAFHPGMRTRLEPFLQVAAVRWSGDSATERGGIGALRVDGRDADVTVGKLGIHAGMATDATHVVGWQTTVAWQHASGDTTPSARLRFADGGESFDVSGVPLARNATTVDAGLSFRLSPAVHLDASYTGQYASGLSDHGGRVSLGVSF